MTTTRALLKYGLLGFPLGFCGLPLYVHIPKFYADSCHISLAVLGVLLLSLRLLDAFSDPWIGRLSDRYHHLTRPVMYGSALTLCAGYGALFNPPDVTLVRPELWLSGSLLVVYGSFSALMINYYARGLRLASPTCGHARIAAYREGSFLAGILTAALLPSLLGSFLSPLTSYHLFGILLTPLLLVSIAVCLSDNLEGKEVPPSDSPSLFGLLRHSDIRWILGIGLCNALPTAITSTLFLFFTQDILQDRAAGGPLLALYFLSAAASMPIWSKASRSFGKKRTLLGAMLAATLCFVWAAFLHAGNTMPFAVICLLSGLTLGADSMLLPAFLSEALVTKPGMVGSGFGLWNFTTKMTLAAGAGIVLPVLSFAGYHSAAPNTPSALRVLSLCYAVAPCFFKLIAIVLLFLSPLATTERLKT